MAPEDRAPSTLDRFGRHPVSMPGQIQPVEPLRSRRCRPGLRARARWPNRPPSSAAALSRRRRIPATAFGSGPRTRPFRGCKCDSVVGATAISGADRAHPPGPLATNCSSRQRRGHCPQDLARARATPMVSVPPLRSSLQSPHERVRCTYARRRPIALHTSHTTRGARHARRRLESLGARESRTPKQALRQSRATGRCAGRSRSRRER